MANDLYADSGGFTAYTAPSYMPPGGAGLPGYPASDLYMQQANIAAAAPTYQAHASKHQTDHLPKPNSLQHYL